jgi:transcriptional regulator GlxA family with amidase domain
MNQSPELLRRLLRAKDRIDQAPNEDWTIARLAAVSAVSPAHFARSFKKAFGLPPHRYLLTRRLERAAALLGESQASVTDIAFETGWQSVGTFSRVFRDVTGDAPSRRRMRERENAQGLAPVPECFVRAARRPDLRSAVLEKRRQAAPGSNGRRKPEVT